MSLQGFTCPSHGEEPGRNNNIEYCLTKCSAPCTSPHVLYSMLEQDIGNYHKGKRISTTMLTGGCKRKTLLSRNIPYYVEPQRGLPTYRGTLIHLVAENVQELIKKYGWELEVHMELPVSSKSGDWVLTGTSDAVDHNRVEITDIKTLQEYAIIKMVTGKNNGVYSDHIPDQYIKQLNIYRYMAEKLGVVKEKIKRLRLQVIAFKDLILTGNKQIIGLKKGYKWTTDEYDIPDVPIIENDEVEKWIQEEGDEWYQILFAGKKAEVVEEDWSWLCKVCVFKGQMYCPDPEAERKGELDEGLFTQNNL